MNADDVMDQRDQKREVARLREVNAEMLATLRDALEYVETLIRWGQEQGSIPEGVPGPYVVQTRLRSAISKATA